ncbi:MAG: hypothetical protein HQL15_10880, partial [Candidatus Omnitrophica bacterium]|nr:hypothetical protein [Candidatus Omnitrophota bacterium]
LRTAKADGRLVSLAASSLDSVFLAAINSIKGKADILVLLPDSKAGPVAQKHIWSSKDGKQIIWSLAYDGVIVLPLGLLQFLLSKQETTLLANIIRFEQCNLDRQSSWEDVTDIYTLSRDLLLLEQKEAQPSWGIEKNIEYRAALGKLILDLMNWNFHIYQLSFQRVHLKSQGSPQADVIKALDQLQDQMMLAMVSYRRAGIPVSIMDQIEKSLPRFKEINDEGLRSPKETIINVHLMAAVNRAIQERETLLTPRIAEEMKRPRVLVTPKGYYIREQMYRGVKSWGVSLLSYRNKRYDMMWDAFRALDHQIDSEMEEVIWIQECQRLLQTLRDIQDENDPAIKEQVSAMLKKLRYIKVEHKKLARIVLTRTLNILGLGRLKQVAGLLQVTSAYLQKRLVECQTIISQLDNKRLAVLRAEVSRRNEYLLQKLAKILHSLKGNRYGLLKTIVLDDFLNPKHQDYMYLREPEFASLRGALNGPIRQLLGQGALKSDDIDMIKQFFELLRDKIVTAKLLSDFMQDYRRLYNESRASGMTRQQAFMETFGDFQVKDRHRRAIANDPDLAWAIFYQAVFISPRNRLFTILSDHITQIQIMNKGYSRLNGVVRISDDTLKDNEIRELADVFDQATLSSRRFFLLAPAMLKGNVRTIVQGLSYVVKGVFLGVMGGVVLYASGIHCEMVRDFGWVSLVVVTLASLIALPLMYYAAHSEEKLRYLGGVDGTEFIEQHPLSDHRSLWRFVRWSSKKYGNTFEDARRKHFWWNVAYFYIGIGFCLAMMEKKESVLVVVSGPSAVGKGPLWEQIQKRYPGRFERVVLFTSRQPRSKEEDGREYHFRSAREIQEMVRENPKKYRMVEVHGDVQALDLEAIK